MKNKTNMFKDGDRHQVGDMIFEYRKRKLSKVEKIEQVLDDEGEAYDWFDITNEKVDEG